MAGINKRRCFRMIKCRKEKTLPGLLFSSFSCVCVHSIPPLPPLPISHPNSPGHLRLNGFRTSSLPAIGVIYHANKTIRRAIFAQASGTPTCNNTHTHTHASAVQTPPGLHFIHARRPPFRSRRPQLAPAPTSQAGRNRLPLRKWDRGWDELQLNQQRRCKHTNVKPRPPFCSHCGEMMPCAVGATMPELARS